MLERLLLNVREAAYRLGISTRHLWNLTAPRGPIPVVRLGRKVFYRPEDLENFVAEMARQSAEVDRPTEETIVAGGEGHGQQNA